MTQQSVPIHPIDIHTYDAGAAPLVGASAGNEGAVLSSADHKLLARAIRFLVGVYPPEMFRRACAHGYSLDEHFEGWRLVRLAGGERRPVGQAQPPPGVVPIARDKLAILQELDEFENLWFPRVRVVIRRVVPSEQHDAFAEAFFRDLEQQPLGPGVVRSVGMLLTRLTSLQTSTAPGAREVLATLARRGLTPERLGRVRALLDEIETPRTETPVAGAVDAEREQRQALEALRKWFRDWATMLRPELSVRERIVLGLKLRRASAGGDAEEDGSDELAPTAAATTTATAATTTVAAATPTPTPTAPSSPA